MINICLSNGLVNSNVYIVGDEGEGVVIDCGVNADEIFRMADSNGLKIKYLILTHCHFDHVYYTDKLKDLTGAKVIIHKNDAARIDDSNSDFLKRLGLSMHVSPPDILAGDGDVVSVGKHNFKFIHTPGHSSGSMCVKVDDLLFTGDTLFKLSMGRTDFDGGNKEDIYQSLAKLSKLPDDTKVYPGHGEETTIKYEKEHNPYLSLGGIV
jgi:hydroxyacylglutathione hydrolase